MKLESQVCSRDLAKKLKELGINQDSLFYWIPVEHGVSPLSPSYDPAWELADRRKALDFPNNTVSAFTVAELGEILPGKIPQKNRGDENGGYLEVMKGLNFWSVSYIGYLVMSAETEADARAKLLIFLLEEGVVWK